MGHVTTSTLKPGMVLSKPVFNDYRQQLADAGTTLDARVITLLQTWGVIDVDVQEIAEPTLQELDVRMSTSERLQALAATIEDRFYGAEPHAFVTELHRLVKLHVLQEAVDEGTHRV
jgi:hypothetical protein